MIDAAAIPQELRDRPQWLIWRFEPNQKFPEKKPIKRPYYTNGNPRVGRQGSDSDRASLRAFDDALVAAAAGNYDGVGFAFLPGDGLIGIDIDKCIDDDGVISPLAVEVIELCGSYTEYSPSRRGFHIIVAGSIDHSFKSDEVGLEVFCKSQYFTFTGNSYGTAPTPVNPISGPAIERLHVLVKGEPGKRRASSPLPPAAIDERAKLESALAYIDCDYSYRQWYRVGMALFSALGESGFAVWDYWSSKGQKYKGPDDLRSHWKSFGQRGQNETPQAATIFHLAIEAGWRPPRERRSPAPPRPPVAPPPPLEQEDQPGVPPGEQNQGEEQIQPGVPPGEENHEGPPPPANVIPIKGKRPSAREQYEAENPPAADAAEGGGKGGAKKTKPARGQSFWDAIDHLLDNFVLLYGTDTAWDEVNRQQLKVQAVRLAFGSDAVKFWLGNSSRRMINFRNLVFDPTEAVDPSTHVNLFDGFATAPKKGECDLIIDLLLHLCDGNEELASWITRWIAYPLQHPGAKMSTSIVMHGDEGSGKNLFWEKVVRAIYGKYGGVIGNAQIESQFNEWASMKMFMVADEVVTRTELRQLKGKLKQMVSGDEISINPKNLPERIEANHINFVFLSNELQPLALDKTDRRYLVVWTPPKRELAYYKAVADQIENGGLVAFHHYLMHEVECGDMTPHTKPLETKAKQRLISLGLSAPERFYREWAAGGLPLPFVCCSAGQLYAAFQRWSHLNGERYPPTQTEFGGKVERMAAGEVVRKVIKYELGEVVKQRTVYVVGQQPEGKTLSDWVEGASTLFDTYLKKYRHVYDQSDQQ